MTELLLVVALVVVFATAVGAGVATWIATRRKPATALDLAPVTLMQQEVAGLRRELAETTAQMSHLMQESNRTIGERLEGAGRAVAEVSGKLGELSAATGQMLEVGKDIAGLQDILRAPKARGGLGEYLLADLLDQILPPDFYRMGHRFRSGETVDAVIRLGPNLVPVDSKFPLENFQRVLGADSDGERAAQRKGFARDVRKHIDAIAAKYILPDEGTYDFALMYVPAENVYYEMIVSTEALCEGKSISAYALAKRVIPVSPNSFYAYLQAIALGLNGLHIEKTAKDVMEHLARLRQDLARFRADFDTVGRHVTNARNKYEDAERRLDRFSDKLEAAAAARPELADGPIAEKPAVAAVPPDAGGPGVG